MSILAISGHSVRGKEVIEILKMLGGREVGYNGLNSQYYYYIDEYGNIAGTAELPNNKILFVIYTLEEFLEKFPYKVGDKVIVSETQKAVTIEHMSWRDNKIIYETCYNNDCIAYYTVNELQPYKEETMEEIKVDIPNGYEFAGVDDDKQQVVFIRIHAEYPKNYWDCAKFINRFAGDKVNGYKYDLILNLQKLLICRNAYWKIAGEQMGLGKPWKPDWLNVEQDKYVLFTHNNAICSNCYVLGHNILAFPTEEMRDIFYGNFKELIESCKELL